MMKEKVHIRQITSEDTQTLILFFKENNVNIITENFNPFPLSEDTARWIACVPKKDRFYLAFANDYPIGFSMLRGWDEGYQVPSFGIFIDHRHHGLGYGKILTEYTIEEAKEIGCEQVRLSVFSNNLHAIHLYKGMGFIETDREDVNNNTNDQKIIMTKDLIQ